jgi:serine/threonine protein phosphatase PrpC
MTLEFFGFTDKGNKRETNEDDFLCVDLFKEVKGLQQPVFLLLVADGVGGHQGGDQASSLASESVREFFKIRLGPAASAPDWPRLVEEACLEANARIYAQASRDSSLSGMGSTLTAGLVVGSAVFLANVGDSRAYCIRREEIKQISQDHSWAEEQRRLKTLSEDEINNSPFKHMITRSLGYEPSVKVDSFQASLEEGDYLLLCTDGLYGILSDRDMLKVFKNQKEPEKICRRLVLEADQAGSRDNITAVVARYRGREKAHQKVPSQTIILDSSKYKGWDF